MKSTYMCCVAFCICILSYIEAVRYIVLIYISLFSTPTEDLFYEVSCQYEFWGSVGKGFSTFYFYLEVQNSMVSLRRGMVW